MSSIYDADIRFLQPVINAYKLGLFNDKRLPVSVINALDSLSWYGNVKGYETGAEAVRENRLPKKRRSGYVKVSPYWKNPKAYRSYGHSTAPKVNQGEGDGR